MSHSPFALRVASILAASVLSHQGLAIGQQNPYSPALLATVRTQAGSIPGPRPQEIRYLAVTQAPLSLDGFLEGAAPVPVTAVIPVFQICYADRWIMIDAGLDSEALLEHMGPKAAAALSRARYDTLQVALRDAETIVLTHEHFDHAIGVQRGPYFTRVASKTVLTRAQLQSLLNPPASDVTRLSADSATGFQVLDYDLVYALAPGVALIRAPGHSPGSQFVYVRLANDREVLLIGDLVWMMPGLTMNHQKPLDKSSDIKEDRESIQRQMDWVRSLLDAGVIAIVPSHDKAHIDLLVERGVLHEGLALGNY